MGQKVSAEEIEKGDRTPTGRYTKKQLERWGVPWPPPKDWEERLKKGLPVVGDPPPEPKKTVQASKFTPKIGKAICDRISLGETLREICQDKNMPSQSTVLNWRQSYANFDREFTRALIDQHHAWADEMVAISRDSTSDWYQVTDRTPRRFKKLSDGQVVIRFHKEHIERQQFRIRTLQWLMQNRKDSDYSPRQIIQLEQRAYDGLSIEEIQRELEAAARLAGYKLVPLDQEKD